MDTETFTFALPGHHPDVQLVIFGKSIYVHSVVLRQHSGFFRLQGRNSPERDKRPFVAVSDDNSNWKIGRVCFLV